jgi:predicted ATPase
MHDSEIEAVIRPMSGNSGAVFPRLHKAQVLWMLGYQDQAIAVTNEAIQIARDIEFLPSIAFAVGYSPQIFALVGDHDRVIEVATEALDVERQLHSRFWEPIVSLWRGWALAMQGDEEGIDALREGLRGHRAAGNGVGQVQMLGRLAEALIAFGRTDEALEVLAEAKHIVEQTGERFFAPELYLLEADAVIVGVDGGSDCESARTAAEDQTRLALEMARQQEAKSLELRAAITLCDLQRAKGDASEGRALLERVYEQFTEGFDMPDLRLARALLDEVPSQ